MRTFLRFMKWLLLGLLGLLLLYVILVIIGGLWATTPQAQACTEQRYEIFISTGGIHLDIVLPVESLPEYLLHPSYQNDTTTHVAFGWGERNFYLETPTWDDLTFSNGAYALLVSSEPIMQVRRFTSAQENWKKFELCPQALATLWQYLDDSFRKTADQDWQQIASTGYSRHHFFYEANGQYHAINTCNTWLNNALKAAQIKTARWSPLTYGILWHLED